MKKVLAALLFLAVGTMGTVQAQTISEDDLPFTFLSWHYNNYPGAENNHWIKLEKNGEELLFVDFQHEGRSLEVTYRTNGRRVKARIIYGDKQVPDLVNAFLMEQFEKYKVNEFMKTDIYDSNGSDVAYFFHSVWVKVKKENIMLYFDEEFNRIMNSDVQLLSAR